MPIERRDLLLAALLALCPPAADAAAPSCAGSFGAAALPLDYLAQAGGPSAAESVMDGLVAHHACRGLGAEGERACAPLRRFATGDESAPTLEAYCLETLRFHRFAAAAAAGKTREALRQCRAWLRPALGRHLGDLDSACRELGRAWSSDFYPACARLAASASAPSQDAGDVEFWCRIELHPVYGCDDAAQESNRLLCEARAAVFRAWRRRDPRECGDDAPCRAALAPATADCAAPLKKAAALWCARPGAGG